jgi:hypothetical protein
MGCLQVGSVHSTPGRASSRRAEEGQTSRIAIRFFFWTTSEASEFYSGSCARANRQSLRFSAAAGGGHPASEKRRQKQHQKARASSRIVIWYRLRLESRSYGARRVAQARLLSVSFARFSSSATKRPPSKTVPAVRPAQTHFETRSGSISFKFQVLQSSL